MKTLMTLLFTTAVTFTFAQARLGSSAADIQQEFRDREYQQESGYDNDGDYYISIQTEKASVFYYFNSERICYLTVIIPNDQGALNFYVELYNSRYVILSSTRWKMYADNGIADIELVYPKTGGYFFMWTDAR